MDIIQQRAVLFSTRVQLSPQIQPVREQTIDKIVEQVLYLKKREVEFSIRELMEEKLFMFSNGTQIITQYDLEKSLQRLLKKSRINRKLDKKIRFKRQNFALAKPAIKEIEKSLEAADSLIDQTVRKLQNRTGCGKENLKPAFLLAISIIFSKLGETYARTIRGDYDVEKITGSPIILSSIALSTEEFEDISEGDLRKAVVHFFQNDKDPDFTHLKWNLCQNYYLSRCLGIDRSGRMLSSKVFEGAQFYLDTNILIQGIDPAAPSANRFVTLMDACRRLNIKLLVGQITIDEFQRVVEYYTRIAERVFPKIPEETAEKINNTFLDVLKRKFEENPELTVQEAYWNFLNPKEILEEHEVTVIDDKWFIDSATSQEIQTLSRSIQHESIKRRQRSKSESSALHDAQLLSWVQLERSERNYGETWLVTLDRTLPEYEDHLRDGPGRPVAVTLDAVLQWISPAATTAKTEEDFAAIFAEAVKVQLLPKDNMFDLRDFIMFAGLEWETKELPAEDVEGCVQHIKSIGPNLDPSNPTDREKLAHEINRYFVDPGRKYMTDVARLEQEQRDIIHAANEREKQLEDHVIHLEERSKDLEESTRRSELKRTAHLKLLVAFFALVILEFIVVYYSSEHGAGANQFQKILDGWPLITFVPACLTPLTWLILKADEVKLIGQSIRKLARLD